MGRAACRTAEGIKNPADGGDVIVCEWAGRASARCYCTGSNCTTADMGFMSEMLAIFSIIVGVALLLTGIGLVILARAVFGRASPAVQVASPAPEPGTAPG